MIKIILLLFSIFYLFGENITIFGEKSITENNKTSIYQGMMIKGSMIVSANQLIYDQNKKIITAKGNVYINYDKNDYILSNEVKINLQTNAIEAKPFFLFNFVDDSWINSSFIQVQSDSYLGKQSIASTCSVNNPDWKIVSTSVKYNKKSKWIDLYNPTLYIKNVPLLYLPYLGFSLNKTRSSGFLTPVVGYSANEGMLLTIPYYQTLTPLADLEIDPTIRTQRGKGIYSIFRFVHSSTSRGEFKIGTFTDKLDYQEKYNLANRTHRGWSFLYTNSSIIKQNDKLYVDLKNANDTDYFYLDPYNYTFQTINDKVLTSKINYYNQDEYNYVGIYAKYFKDTSKISNDDTMQVLPQIQYHRFNDNFWKDFSYSVDTNFYNYTRSKGYKAMKESIILPINYNINFFDDYLKLSLTEQLSAFQVNTTEHNTSKLSRIDTFIKVYTNLSKKYPSFIHHIAASITFGMDNYYHYNGVGSDYIDTSLVKKSVSLKLNQYLIAKNWQIDHKVSEVYYLDNDVGVRYSNLLNEISINYNHYYLKDNNKYSFEYGKVNYNSATLGFNDNKKMIEGGYVYQREYENNPLAKSYSLKGYWKFDRFHKLFASFNYDLVLQMQKYEIFGISMKKKCWNYSLSYKKETIPLLTNDGISSIIQKTIYFQIELVPLGGVSQQYQFKNQKG